MIYLFPNMIARAQKFEEKEEKQIKKINLSILLLI